MIYSFVFKLCLLVLGLLVNRPVQLRIGPKLVHSLNWIGKGPKWSEPAGCDYYRKCLLNSKFALPYGLIWPGWPSTCLMLEFPSIRILRCIEIWNRFWVAIQGIQGWKAWTSLHMLCLLLKCWLCELATVPNANMIEYICPLFIYLDGINLMSLNISNYGVVATWYCD